MTKRITSFLITLFFIFCLTGCSWLNSCPEPNIPHKPILESSHKIRKDITYTYKGEEFKLEKDGLYMDQGDVKQLKHYIDSMQNELEDLQ